MSHAKIKMNIKPQWLMAGKDTENGQLSVGGLLLRVSRTGKNTPVQKPPVRELGISKLAKDAIPRTKRLAGSRRTP
jgi:hypothetical protein